MSRLPLPDTLVEVPTPPDSILLFEYLDESPVMSAEIQRWTAEDKELTQVLHYTRQDWLQQTPQALRTYTSHHNELSVHDEFLLWEQRVIIPPPARKRVLQDLHTGHPGITRMKALDRSFL